MIIRLAWDAPQTDVDGTALDGELSYEIVIRKDGNILHTLVVNDTRTSIDSTELGMLPGRYEAAVYTLEMEAGSLIRSPVSSNSVSFVVPDNTLPKPPTNLIVS